MLLLSLKYKNIDNLEEVFIITEESEASNDNKAFKKIPAICKILNLDCMSLPKLIKQYRDINLEFS
jgi:hypothetical protein